MSKNQMRSNSINISLNGRLVLNPVIRTRIIWLSRVWMINLIGKLEVLIKGIFRLIRNITLIIITALFLI